MFLSALLSYLYKDGITADLFLSGVAVSIVGLLMLFLNKSHDKQINKREGYLVCLLYTSPSPRDVHLSRMPSSA